MYIDQNTLMRCVYKAWFSVAWLVAYLERLANGGGAESSTGPELGESPQRTLIIIFRLLRTRASSVSTCDTFLLT